MQAIKAVGATLCYLPSYSPDLNPIEKHFAKLKTLLRKAALRTVDTLWTKVGVMVVQISDSFPDQFPGSTC